MKRKIIIASIGLLMLIVSSAVVYNFFPSANTLQSINDAGFLDDQAAVVYYSTTMDSKNRKGFVVFIDHQGETHAMETEGLELGRLGYSDNSVFFQDETKNYMFTSQLEEEDRGKVQYTGDYVGKLNSSQSFFSIFNSGMGDDGETYQSDIYWHHDNELKEDVLPFYIESRGNDDTTIYTVHREDLESKEFTLSQTELSNHADTRQIMTWETINMATPVSNIHVLENNIYYLEESYQEDKTSIQLMELNLETKKVTDYSIVDFMSEEEHYEALPYDTKKSGYLYGNTFYYIDGTGLVYATDIESGETEESFMIEDTARHGDFVQVDWKDEKLYVYYNNTGDTVDAGLVSYNVESGEKLDTIEINGLEEIIGMNEALFSYDLLILD
ncbi:hypothetical protein QGM71_08445 [Virgibacillus sp. C22-A2]|uniref:DUF5050 domain-containing protein n=1 Tax=Virgibacillus tibetensis TaxID=3042313 RepID=A0ABU6KEJ7_9BACI|nr:hypothetical protein [Virgibacillus sp. C22-A2]